MYILRPRRSWREWKMKHEPKSWSLRNLGRTITLPCSVYNFSSTLLTFSCVMSASFSIFLSSIFLSRNLNDKKPNVVLLFGAALVPTPTLHIDVPTTSLRTDMLCHTSVVRGHFGDWDFANQMLEPLRWYIY